MRLLPGTLLTALCALSSVQAETVVNHAQGETTLSGQPEAVLTFDIASLDTLDALGVEVDGMPKAFLPPRLSHYSDDRYTNIGSLFEPDFETVASMDPDLIIVANRSSTAYDDLNKLAPTIDMTVWGEGFLDQFKATTRTLAAIFDKTDEAEQRLDALDARVEQARTLAAETGEALVVMTSGGKLTAYGPGSRFGWIHDDLGLATAVTDLEEGTHGDPISFEYLLETDPEVIFVIDRDGAIDPANQAARATLDNDLVKRTRAYQNDRIVYLDSVNWYIVMSGLPAVEQMVEEVIAGLSS